MNKLCPPKGGRRKGFTLIELLIVIAIIAILAVIIIIAINPARILNRSEDSQRFSDLTSLATAVNLFLADGQDFTGVTCLPPPGIPCVSNGALPADNVKKQNDGTGWIAGLDFGLVSSGAPIATLPLDPENDATNYYRFAVVGDPDNTYELQAVFEDAENIPKHDTDGGDDPAWYEVGTDLTIL